MKTLFGVLLILSAPVLGVVGLLMVGADLSGGLYFILAIIAFIGGLVLTVLGMEDKRKLKMAAQQGGPALQTEKKPHIALKIVAIIATIIVAMGVLWLISLLLITTH